MSPYFAAACRGAFLEAHSRRIDLPDEEPEIFSCVLEYLYKGRDAVIVLPSRDGSFLMQVRCR